MKEILFLLLSSATCVLVFAFGQAYFMRVRAGHLLGRSEHCSQAEYRRFLLPDQKTTFGRPLRSRLYLDNPWLVRTHLAPGAPFTAAIETTGNKLSIISVGLNSPPAYFTRVREVSADTDSTPYRVGGRRVTSGPVKFSINIDLTPAAAPELRQLQSELHDKNTWL